MSDTVREIPSAPLLRNRRSDKEAAGVATKFIARFGSIFDPLAYPGGVSAINGFFAIGRCDAWNNIIVGR